MVDLDEYRRRIGLFAGKANTSSVNQANSKPNSSQKADVQRKKSKETCEDRYARTSSVSFEILDELTCHCDNCEAKNIEGRRMTTLLGQLEELTCHCDNLKFGTLAGEITRAWDDGNITLLVTKAEELETRAKIEDEEISCPICQSDHFSQHYPFFRSPDNGLLIKCAEKINVRAKNIERRRMTTLMGKIEALTCQCGSWGCKTLAREMRQTWDDGNITLLSTKAQELEKSAKNEDGVLSTKYFICLCHDLFSMSQKKKKLINCAKEIKVLAENLNSEGKMTNTEGERGNTEGKKENTSDEKKNIEGEKGISESERENTEGEKGNTNDEKENTEGEKGSSNDEKGNTNDEMKNTESENRKKECEKRNTEGEIKSTEDERRNPESEKRNTKGEKGNTKGEKGNTEGEKRNTECENRNKECEKRNTEGESRNRKCEKRNTEEQNENRNEEMMYAEESEKEKRTLLQKTKGEIKEEENNKILAEKYSTSTKKANMEDETAEENADFTDTESIAKAHRSAGNTEVTLSPSLKCLKGKNVFEVYQTESLTFCEKGDNHQKKEQFLECDEKFLKGKENNIAWMYDTNKFLLPRSISYQTYHVGHDAVDTILNRYFSPSPPTKRETMAYELLRLCTLHDFPTFTGQSCIRLAQAGFYYEGKDDEVTCFSCSIQICGWQPKDIPMDRHRDTSMNCLFIKCQNSGNVPIQSNAEANPVCKDVKNAASSNDKDKFVMEVKGCTSGSSSSSASSSSSGSVSQVSGISNDSGFSSASSSSSQPTGSSSSSSSQSYITTPGSSSSTSSSDTQYTVTCTNRNRAHYPEYVLKNDRIQSFKRGWPDYVQQTPEMMVESGFFFAGYEDCVRCFQCGIGLRNWEPPDNPHVEHARWSPKCPFLLGIKGQDFINLVLDAVAQLALRNEQSVSTPAIQTDNNPAKAALLQASQQPYQRSATTRNPVKTGASAGTDAAGSFATTSQTTPSASNTGISQCDAVESEQAKNVLKKGFSEKEVKRAIEKIVEKEGWKGVSEERVLKMIQEEKQRERSHPPGLRGGNAGQMKTTLPSDIVELKKKNREMREMTICKICLEEEVSIVFLPCGHLVACAQCAPALSRCAVCRKPITGTVCAHLDV